MSATHGSWELGREEEKRKVESGKRKRRKEEGSKGWRNGMTEVPLCGIER
jgi:hypothetical protein